MGASRSLMGRDLLAAFLLLVAADPRRLPRRAWHVRGSWPQFACCRAQFALAEPQFGCWARCWGRFS